MHSRSLQNYQHIVGAIHQLLLLTTGIYIGKDNIQIAIVLGILFLIFSRLSSEIWYQTLQKIQSEKLIKLYGALKNNKT